MKIVFGLLLILLTFAESGCSTSKSIAQIQASLAPSLAVEASGAFQKALPNVPDSSEVRQARIDYLLERMGDSPYNFIRNGSRYNGKHAEIHLKWKYLRSQREVETAEAFIDRIATRSKLSGEEYLVILPDKSRRPLRDFLLYELHSFDQSLEEKRHAHS